MQYPSIKFIFAGTDIPSNLSVANKFSNITLLDATNTPEDIYRISDLCVLASIYGEGFPNVISESLSCGTLCAVTDSGDSFSMVNSFGFRIDGYDWKSITDSILEAYSIWKSDNDYYNNLALYAASNNSFNSINDMVGLYLKEWDHVCCK